MPKDITYVGLAEEYTLEQLKEFRRGLINITFGDINRRDLGICWNLSVLIAKDREISIIRLNCKDQLRIYSFIQDYSLDWDEHSGNEMYPVPNPNGLDKWDNPARLRLLEFLLAKVTEAILFKAH